VPRHPLASDPDWHQVMSGNHATLRDSMLRLTPAEEAHVARLDAAQDLRDRLAGMSLDEFRVYADAIPDDDDGLIAARQEARDLATRTRRCDDVGRVTELVEIGAYEAGGEPIGFRPVREDGTYEVINGQDFDRSMRLRERARDHALAIVLSDLLSDALADRLRLPGLPGARSQ